MKTQKIKVNTKQGLIAAFYCSEGLCRQHWPRFNVHVWPNKKEIYYSLNYNIYRHHAIHGIKTEIILQRKTGITKFKLYPTKSITKQIAAIRKIPAKQLLE